MSFTFGSFSIDVPDLICRLCNCIAPHKDYVCNLKENIEILRTEKERLAAKKKDVTREVEIAELRHQRERLHEVQHWLTRVERMEAEVDQLLADASQEIEKNCLGGCCPKNCLSTYKQGKKVAKKIKQVTNLKEEGNLTEVAGEQLLLSGSAAERPSRPAVGLESAFNEAQSYIGDGVGIIGIYGMGGVGKTTLLTQINNNLCANFDLVIWLVVSQNSTIGKVQDGIGEKLGFHGDEWKNKCQEDKATSIFRVLKRKRFVLLLDDIWERIDLLKVGVPVPPDEYNKSKVVFTTRSEDVCGRMETQKKIKVECLVPEKAWDLFREKVGEAALNSHSEIPELAKILAKECKGLPLALITIGRAMACKTSPQEWHHALDVMKENAAKFSGMGDEVLPTLKFSYDYLRSDVDRSCFLYCSLFPEDYCISKQRLIEYWIGEGLLDGFNDLNKGYDIIGTLIHACLLEEVSYDSVPNVIIVLNMIDKVKMHDVIRDMALWIASKYGEAEDNFLVQAGNKLETPPHIGKRKDVERMSLMHNEIKELIETPSCPNLSTLFLSGNRLKMITPDFFQNMANLKVLDLSINSSLEVLPVEISELVSLQYLNLSWTGIKKLPIEYKNLVNLKYLNLEYTKSSDIIPLGLLSSFKKLGVLKIFRESLFPLIFDKDSDFEAFLREVEGLKDLNQFSLSIRTISTLSHMLRSPKILSCTNLLGLFCVEGLKSQDLSFLQSMRCLQHLVFQFCEDLEDLKVETTREEEANSDVIISHAYCFHSLRSIDIGRSKKLKEVTWLRFAPNLEILRIESCDGMEEVICHGKYGEASAPEEGGGYLNLFARLKELQLYRLPQLKSIYPNAQSFPCLKFLSVTRCPNLKKLPLNSDSARGCLVQIEGETEWWNELEWEDEATQNAFLPFFKSQDFYLTDCEIHTASVLEE